MIVGIRDRLARARRVVALAGCALRAEGAQLPADPANHATRAHFFEDPVTVWSRYDERRARLAAARPGPAHRALAALERRAPEFTLATESTDGLHRRAGSRAVIELRGSIWQVRCTRCGLGAANHEVPIPNPPSCPACTGLARPDVVWHGEHLPEERLVRCFEVLSRCDFLLVAGSDGRRPPAASFIEVARRSGAFCVEIAHAGAAQDCSSDVHLAGDPDEILPRLVPEEP